MVARALGWFRLQCDLRLVGEGGVLKGRGIALGEKLAHGKNVTHNEKVT